MTFTTSQIDELVDGAAAAIGPGDITWIAAPGPLYFPPKPMIERAADALAPVRAFLRRKPSMLFTGIAAGSVVMIVGAIMMVARYGSITVVLQ